MSSQLYQILLRHLRFHSSVLIFEIKIKGWVDVTTKIVVKPSIQRNTTIHTFFWGLSYLNHLRTPLDKLLIFFLHFIPFQKQEVCVYGA